LTAAASVVFLTDGPSMAHHLTPDRAYLRWTQTVEDPVVIGNRGVRYNVFERRDGTNYVEVETHALLLRKLGRALARE
jgi:hypothetical protein